MVETAEIYLNDLDAAIETTDKVIAMFGNQLHLVKADLIELWEMGILSDVAFIHFALKMDTDKIRKTGSIDKQAFCADWRGADKDLTEPKLMKALATLQAKGLIEVGSRQLEIQFV